MMVICEGEFGSPINLWDCAEIRESTQNLRSELNFSSDLGSGEEWNLLLETIDKGIEWVRETKGRGKHAICGSLIAYVYFHLGFQVGATHRLFKENGISWGTYSDQLATMHCNAHPNNFVVLSAEESSNNQWIAPLDFDMAYDWDSFVGDEEAFKSNSNTEKQALKTALCGMDINSGAKPMDLKSPLKPLLVGLRDTLICGFEAKDDAPYCEELRKPVHALFRLALLMTLTDIA